MPIIGTKMVSPRIRMVLSVLVTILVMPMLPPLPQVAPLSINSLLIVLHQVIIGLAIGFVLQLIFQTFILAGQFIAMKMGLGFASMNDPTNGVSVTVISQYYSIMTIMLFLSLNGHHVVFMALVESFTTLPIQASGFNGEDFWVIVSAASWMFSRALSISLPVLTALLVVNIAFGVMSRAAPQMNVFAVGFPITLVFGMLLMWVSLPSFLPNYILFMGEGLSMVENLLRLP
jgi:flagellar biosynthetic protein FliR